ncbi:MAG TPA: SufD family Fe-S cluster assembly protein [archaeon]|nr:SufD family Fe-S cluster assembly protein [archaeon]
MQQTSYASVQWLEEYRQKNQKIFQQKPVKKSKYTSIAKLEELLITPTKEQIKPKKLPGGIFEIITLNDALANKQIAQKIQKILSLEENAKDQFEAFINANFDSGFVIILKKGSHDARFEIELPQGSCSKYFIIVEKGTDATILERIKTTGNCLVSETIYLEENSNLTVAKIHEEQGDVITYQQCIAQKDAKLYNCNAWLSGNLVRANTSNILQGIGSEIRECSLLISSAKEHFDLNYSSIHRSEATFSHCVFKSALKDESKMVFDGMIRIEESAQKANALLECHSMILGQNASSNQIPSLEIKTDDVKATHSATVARIDEEELFYVQSRGMKKEEAKKMIVKSFLESVIYLLPAVTNLPPEREKGHELDVRHILEKEIERAV